MAWTPFGKSSTSTAVEPLDEPNTNIHPPEPTAAAQVPTDDGWFSNLEGQLAVDVYQTATDIVIKAPIAGVKPEGIDIAITDDVVTIKGERLREDNIEGDDYYCQECYYGIFSRSIILPVAVSTDEADATFVNGVLTVTIPKADRAKTKKLEIKSL